MVNRRGLIALVNGCTKPECAPFKAWVSEVVETVQRDGSYSLDLAPVQPAPTGGTAYLMPQPIADAIVRLEEVASRTGLTLGRVHDCVRMLIKRGCVRQVGSAEDGVPVYVLP
ncbi:hypothetical protein ABZ478_24540 [Streptomyces sp. NPDC005706]|uniref:helix-turn-helix domain-containing protein n=1 Tax=Streptomyces sp. NPDC005706 TaxID=3157169 RepID=UPI0033CA76C1